MAAEDEAVSKTFDFLVSEGFQFTFVPEGRGEHISAFLDDRTTPQYRLSKDSDGSVSLLPSEEGQGQHFGFIVESKPSEDALLGEDKWVDGGVRKIRDSPDNVFRVEAKALDISERTQLVKFQLDLGFSYLVKEKTVDIRVDLNWLSAAVANRFSSDDLDRHGSSVFGHYVDRIDVILSPQGLIGGIRPRTHPRMESSDVAETKEETSTRKITASSKPAAELGLARRRGRERKIQTMRETSFVSAEKMDAAGFRWEVIRWEHENGLEYNKIEPERVWRNRSAVSRRQIQLPYVGDGPGIQKDSFWAIWEVQKDEFAEDNTIRLKVDAMIQLRLLYQKYSSNQGWFFGSKCKKFHPQESADVDLEIYLDAAPNFD